ncbi:protein-glutamate methylesterase/protein-glutamine glutaminase [Aneurinibacillus terranovensis]|uniref:protein-glutamate methylesterase/protein-glutamine glutaminase n=1 Tax=Aneurinibacillus terranovensis TaxID=278991 RepID=UPI00048396F5|nr:chemotaxis response regulator protein-glutamate methylesterase [Aneurinibacillus terranovensis]
MKKIKAIIIDDSAFMRKVIGDLLAEDPDIEVIGKARNGREGVDLVQKLNPDVVTLDIEMPVLNGLQTLEIIMKDHPLPVVMLSSLTQQGANETIRALEMGAVDFIAKPSGSISLDLYKVGSQIIEKVKAAAQVNLPGLKRVEPSPAKRTGLSRQAIESTAPAASLPNRSLQAKPFGSKDANYTVKGNPTETNKISNFVAVGTSTGGPKALQTFLRGLPESFNGALAIVQHMPPGFTRSLAQRLDSLCDIRVVEAEHNQVIEKGFAYIAPGNYHMEIKQKPGGELYVSLNQNDPRGGHRPSVDTLFESVAMIQHPAKHAVIMTGMGNDGTAGLKRLKQTGLRTAIAEDESTCVVFGMPRAAIQSGMVDITVPLYEIADQLLRSLNR